MRIGFYKMHGAGNDFIVVDARMLGDAWATPERVADLNARRLGIGAEGLILLLPSRDFDFRMRFFNPDGGEAALCGNGARCIARLAHALGVAPGNMRFETAAGPLAAEIIEGGAALVMPPIRDRQGPHLFTKASLALEAYALRVGVPHLVVRVPEVRAVDVAALGRWLREAPQFAPEGINVNFVSSRQGEAWDIRTYERGVEAESGACGTGAVAAAAVLHEHYQAADTLALHTRDGFVLSVALGHPHGPRLAGPAVEVFRGEICVPQ